MLQQGTYRYGKLLQKSWFPDADIPSDACCWNQGNPKPSSYNESFFGSLLDDASDTATAGQTHATWKPITDWYQSLVCSVRVSLIQILTPSI